MYGRKYVAAFQQEIQEIFEHGEQENSSKLGPDRILEVLKLRHPGRFDLPYESELRQEITKMMKKENR